MPADPDPPVSAVLAPNRVGLRRRPSGEPPPLPHEARASTRWYVAAAVATAALSAGLASRPVLRSVTTADRVVLRGIADLRVGPVTAVMRRVAALGSPWVGRVAGWVTIAVLVGYRRFRYLAVYLLVLLSATVGAFVVAAAVGRPRPAAAPLLTGWDGYAFPSRPVVTLALASVGVVYTLLPSGPARVAGKWAAAALILALGAARLYLGVDHPTDVLAAVVLGWALPVVVFRLATPEQAFPISYRRGRRAHLDVGGRRGEAIVEALERQLALTVTDIEPFGLGGSAGSTPLRLAVRRPDGRTEMLFAKLYALNHLRSDRWYKLTRTVLYGRLEDEKPFSTVRRLAEYEDHMLRLGRDLGLPTPAPFGFAEITPEREYVIVMEFFEGAQEVGSVQVGPEVVDDALAIVRRLWDAGIAHRDIKPSNLLVRGDHAYLIDVAFAAVRPTPWRQAVDLANMMLTLALSSDADVVYERALRLFAPDDIAEGFAATRSVTVPTQLRNRLRADGRDLVRRFRQLAPDRPPVPIQVWTLQRAVLTAWLVALVGLGVGLAVAYVQVAGLL